MRGFLYVLAAIGVIALAFWAYRENHQTQQVAAEVHSLQREITTLREAIAVQRAEWAYLNRPDRLRELADLNFDRLGLIPMDGEHFGRVDQVSYPPAEIHAPRLSRPVDVFAPLEPEYGEAAE